jgi:hypothetical protein
MAEVGSQQNVVREAGRTAQTTECCLGEKCLPYLVDVERTEATF